MALIRRPKGFVVTTETWIPVHEELNPRGLFGLIDRVVCWIVVAGLLLIALILVAQVFARYAVNHPTVWSEELAVSLFVWVAMLAVPMGFRRGEHLTLDFLVKRLGPTMTRVSAVIIAALSALTLFAIGWLALQLLPAGDRQLLSGIASGLGIPAKVSWVYLAIPVGCALSLVFVFERLILLFRGKVTVMNEDADHLIVEQLDTDESQVR